MGTRHHPEAEGEPYFVTFTTEARQAIFQRPDVATLFVEQLQRLRHELRFLLLAYVIMPDHVHLVLVPREAANLARIMQFVKGRFSRAHHQRFGGEGSLWQRRYYETVVRGEGSLMRRIDYVEANPVQADLVDEPAAYAFSSAAHPNGDLEQYPERGLD